MQPSVTELIGGADSYASHSGVNAILKVYGDCLTTEHAHGRAWYRHANRFAAKVAALTGKHPDTVAAILARVSPQVAWSDNKAAALEIASGAAGNACAGCYPDNVARAERIAELDNAEVIAAEVLPRKGYARPKISAFYVNISAPEDAHTVTVDTWAARIWIGDCETPALRISSKESARIQADYRTAAAVAGVLPQVLQAIVWVGAHRMARDNGQRSLFDIGLQFKI